MGYYVPPGEPCSGKVAIIAPLADFTKSCFSYKIVTSQDSRFHGIEYPLRKLRHDQQLIKYRAVNPDLSEEDYRTMIFGPTSDAHEIIYDPSAGANLEGGEPLEVIDSDIVEYENIPMEEMYDSTRPPTLTGPLVNHISSDVEPVGSAVMPNSASRSMVDDAGLDARAADSSYGFKSAQKAPEPDALGFLKCTEGHGARCIRCSP